MDFGVGAAAAAVPCAQRGAKRRGNQQTEVDVVALQESVVLVAKLCLSNKQAIRKLSAISMTQFSICADSQFVKVAKVAMDKFMQMAEKMKGGNPEDRDSQLGIPSIHIMDAVLSWALQVHVTANQADQVARIKDFQEAVNKSTCPKTTMGVCVPHFMVVKPHDKRLRRVEIGMDQEMLALFRVTVMPVLAKEKSYRALLGSAPRGQLERQIQGFLDDAKEEEL
jgi:hypothetical protein